MCKKQYKRMLFYFFMSMENKLKCALFVWGLYGYNRGINAYNYRYRDNNPVLYTTKIAYDFWGTFVYINPVLMFIVIPKELYRLEVNIRNLEDEKKSRFYNELI